MTKQDYEDEVLGITDRLDPPQLADVEDEETARERMAIDYAIILLTEKGYKVTKKAPF